MELTVEDCAQGPRFWLNSTTKTEARSWYNGKELNYPLVYNAGFSVMTRNIKDAVVTTLMLGLFGLMVTLVTAKKQKESKVKAPAVIGKLTGFYKKHRLIFGGLLVVGIVGLLFFYVYDTQIRIVMNTTERAEVITSSEPEVLQFANAEGDIVQIVTCEEETLTGLGVMIHVPEGAIPKDGPSAGVTMVTSIASLLTQRKVRSKIAMTGEITLRGKVLPVGGIKEKILAAKRAGITDILLCALNRKDIEEIDEKYLKGLTFHYVNTIREVLDFALLDEKVDNALIL